MLFEASKINLQEQHADILDSESNLLEQHAGIFVSDTADVSKRKPIGITIVEILFSDIAEVSKLNTMGIIPNGLLIITKGKVIYKFVVWRRGKLIELINSRL